MDELHRAVAPFIHSSGGGLPGGSMGHSGGRSPLRRGVVRGERECGPSGYGRCGASSKSGKKGVGRASFVSRMEVGGKSFCQ
ncbi:hypothetical protein Tco_1037539, partial [Tanacetum coccineum]